MNPNQEANSPIIAAVVLVFIALAIVTTFPVLRPHWGNFTQTTQETILVTGTATEQVSNQVASFSVTVTSTNLEKETAVNEVNQSVSEMITKLEAFGIESNDLKTQSTTVYEVNPDWYPRPMGAEPAMEEALQWQASSTLEVILRDVSRSSELSDMLFAFPLAQVYGPNFRVDELAPANIQVLEKAMENATAKAQAIAEASGRKLGKVLTVIEGYDGYDSYPAYRGYDTAEVQSSTLEPGSSVMTKSVTVTFSLK